jgi:dTDP-4-amino-4,6-dideoxygalactose transaminase
MLDEADRADAQGGTAIPFVTLDREHAALANELYAAFERVVRRSSFILGEEVDRFEEAWAAECGVAECVGVGSGTAALAVGLLAAGVGPGDEVIVPAHTYIASALGVLHTGAVPVLCDVEEGTGLLDVEAAAAAIGPRTAAILVVHLHGQLCDMPAFERLAARHGLVLFEDAAQAHGAEGFGRRAGAFGLAAAFSFYPSKNLGALGDAGAICTNHPDVARIARQIRNLGQRHKGEHVLPGVNERLDGLQAAFLNVKLAGLQAANTARRRHAATYRALLEGRVRLLEDRSATPCVYHLFPVRTVERDAVAAGMRGAGIATGVHYSPALHRQPALRGLVVESGELMHAEAWAREELSLPMAPQLRTAEIEAAARACAAAVEIAHLQRSFELEPA